MTTDALSTFSIDLAPGDRDRPTVVVVAGDLDISTCESLLECLEDGEALRTSVVLDLSDVTFMDSMGLRALWSIRQRVATVGGHTVLRAPSDGVMRVLRTTKLDKVFECVDVQPSGLN